MIIGRLKHSLKEKCPECGKVLQLRVKENKVMENGILIDFPEEFIICSNKSCEYMRNVEKKRARKRIEE